LLDLNQPDSDYNTARPMFT